MAFDMMLEPSQASGGGLAEYESRGCADLHNVLRTGGCVLQLPSACFDDADCFVDADAW